MAGKPTNPKLYAKAKAIVKARVKKWPSAYASGQLVQQYKNCLLYTSPSPRDATLSRMPSSA